MDTLSAAILLLLIMDPVGNVPLFLSTLRHVPAARRRKVLIRELLIALAALLVFLFFGRTLLHLLSLKQQAISIAGGIVLFLISLRMIFPTRGSAGDHLVGDQPHGEPLIVPLAIPLIAGPSTFATLVLLVSREPDRIGSWLIAVVVAWVVTAATLLSATSLQRLLGERGITAVERLMGMLLVAVSVQMTLDGVAQYLAAVPG